MGNFLAFGRLSAIFCLFLGYSFIVTGQNERGYMVLFDTISTDGNIRYFRSNPNWIEYRQGYKSNNDVDFTKYHIDSVTEFVLQSGNNIYDRYVRKRAEVNGEEIYFFARVLEKGDIYLYESPFRETRFFWEKDSLLGIPENSFREILGSIKECEDTPLFDLSRTRYRRQPVSYFFREFNKGNYSMVMPVSVAGVYSQLNFGTFKINDLRVMGYPVEKSMVFNPVYFSVGLYGDIPVWKVKRLSVTTKVGHESWTGIGSTGMIRDIESSNLTEIDVKIQNSFLSLEVLPRYVLNKNRFRPFVAAGILGKISLASSSERFLVRVENNQYQYFLTEDVLRNPEYFAGFIIEQGFQFDILSRTSIETCWGYSHLTGFSPGGFSMNNLFINLKLNLWLW